MLAEVSDTAGLYKIAKGRNGLFQPHSEFFAAKTIRWEISPTGSCNDIPVLRNRQRLRSEEHFPAMPRKELRAHPTVSSFASFFVPQEIAPQGFA